MRLYQESIDGPLAQNGPSAAAETQTSSSDYSPRQVTIVITEQFEKTREDFGDIIRGSYSGI